MLFITVENVSDHLLADFAYKLATALSLRVSIIDLAEAPLNSRLRFSISPADSVLSSKQSHFFHDSGSTDRDLIPKTVSEDSSFRPPSTVPCLVSPLERAILPDLISEISARPDLISETSAAPNVSPAPAKDSENICNIIQRTQGAGSHRRLTLLPDSGAFPDPSDRLVAPCEVISSVLLPDLRETLPDLHQLPAAAQASLGRARAQSSGDRGGDEAAVASRASAPQSTVSPPAASRPSLSEPQTAEASAGADAADPSLVEVTLEGPGAGEACGARRPNGDAQPLGRGSDSAESL